VVVGFVVSIIATLAFAPPAVEAATKTVTVAGGIADASGATGPAWTATAVTAPVTGPVTFALSWTGTGDLDMSLKTLPGKAFVVNNVGTARPKSMTANLTAGSSYQLAVWAQTGVGTYTATMTYDDGVAPPPGDTLEIADARADATNATGPRWASYLFQAPVGGSAEVILAWPTASADLRFTVKNSAGTVVGASSSAGPSPKTATLSLTNGAQYRFNVWAVTGASDFTAVLQWEGGGPTTTTTQPPTGRPNIVYVTTDDQRPELSYLQQITNRLAARGTTYTRAYVTTPACCPSRASFMSGQYVHNNGQFQQLLEPGFDVEIGVQRYMQQAGYYTGHAGKFVHWWELADGVAPYWDRWTYFKGGYNDVWMNMDGVTARSSGYSTKIVFDKAIEYLDDFEDRNDGTPWFLQLTPIAPHAPSTPEAKYANAAVPAYTGNPATNETDRSDKPQWVRNNNHTVQSVAASRTAMIRTLYTVDEQVGRLIDYLEANGEMGNTLFIFTSDNGYQWAEHGLIEKFLPYTPSVAVPLVMRWDGVIPTGATDNRLIAHIDVTATILAAAGVSTGSLIEPIDGHDILSGYSRQVALTEYWQDDRNLRAIPNWAAITTDQYQYTEYYDPANPTVIVFREYYNLVNDPWQLVNLLNDGNTGNDPNLTPLHNLVVAQKACAGSTCG
jgi:arylsulfatase A-like enzyme